MQPQSSPKVRWEWIGEGWKLFTQQWQSWVLMTLAYIVIAAIPAGLIYGLMLALIFSSMDPNSGAPPQVPVTLFLVYPLFALVILLLSAWLMSGMYRAAFKQLRGGQVAVSDLFSGGPYFLRMLGALLLMGLLSIIGAMLCFLPALAVPGLMFFAIPLIIEGNVGAVDALRTSFETTKKDWLMFILFAIVLNFLSSAGVYACGIGLLATLPLLFLTHAVAYRDCFSVAGAQSYAPSIPPPPPQYAEPLPQPAYGVPEPQPRKFCLNCGAEIRSGSKFCPRCGTAMPV
ncbi:MAG TPA: zinc-ribbon domain-containing protein [Blastocatellia bacterium]|nr:zinc-ribbon domain-containing protein [Blastocatellia bacterium]